ncbi:MAG: alpha/beta hydrolase [Dehalococcoidia bacterium]|nr:alpha/beta hydrolase [Dehalococcoidia bacterium]
MPTVTSTNGCTIWYDTLGDGPPVVMLYGIGGNSRRWWSEFPELLAKRYCLVMLDNRGTGFSDKPETGWAMSDMTADVRAVVDDLGLASFHLLGCSLGTVIARQYVREHGGAQLRSLSLLCPPNGTAATPEDLQTALFWDRTKPLLDSARATWPIIHPGEWAAANDGVLVAEFEETMRDPTPARTIQFQYEAAGAAPDPNPSLHEHDWPVLVLHGTADRLVPPENARTLAAAVPRAQLAWLEGASHNFWQHTPARSAEAVLAFLDSAEARLAGR